MKPKGCFCVLLLFRLVASAVPPPLLSFDTQSINSSSCPPGITCLDDGSHEGTVSPDEKHVRSSRIGPKFVLPLPRPHEDIGEPIEDFPGSPFEPQSSVPTLLPAGYECHQGSECNDTLSCEPFVAFRTLASGNLTQQSGHTKRSVTTNLCSERNCDAKCNLAATNSIKCPPDSYTVEWESDDKQCCIQTCKCLPDACASNITKNNCSSIYDLVRQGTQEPGNCCDTIRCIEDNPDPKSGFELAQPNSCIADDNTQHAHGEQWFTGRPECKSCTCHSGAVICSELPHESCPLTLGCTNDPLAINSLAPDQCCRPCKACPNPYRTETNLLPYMYPHGETWADENNCGECTCTDGNAKCYTESCRSQSCERNQSMHHPEGTCCPPCSCNLDCGPARGYKRDANGFELCECAEVIDAQLGPLPPLSELDLDRDSTISSERFQVSNTPSPPCLESEDTTCESGETANTSWIAVVACVLIIAIFLGGWFVGRCLICKQGNTSSTTTTNQVLYKPVPTDQQQLQQQYSVDEQRDSFVKVDESGGPQAGQQAKNGHLTANTTPPAH